AVLRERAKVELVGDAELEARAPRREAIVEVTLADGTQLNEHVKAVRGTSDNPMPRAEVVAKCRDLITPVLGAAKCAALIERVLALESMAKHRLQQIRPRSLPGLTRQSIVFDEALFSMDARVKPGHDKSRAAAVGIVPGHGHAQKNEEAPAMQRNGRVNSGDVSIFYRAFGARGRTPILLMHGANYFDSYDWIGVAEALASDREV